MLRKRMDDTTRDELTVTSEYDKTPRNPLSLVPGRYGQGLGKRRASAV